jgi:hypothetical protein
MWKKSLIQKCTDLQCKVQQIFYKDSTINQFTHKKFNYRVKKVCMRTVVLGAKVLKMFIPA